jgi:hypothetical protein
LNRNTNCSSAHLSLLSLIATYFLMYPMINVNGYFYDDLNKFYMAVIMTVPMFVFELLLVASMYQNKRLNMVIIVGSIPALITCFLFITQQTAINDRQFLKAMFPRHSSTILM